MLSKTKGRCQKHSEGGGTGWLRKAKNSVQAQHSWGLGLAELGNDGLLHYNHRNHNLHLSVNLGMISRFKQQACVLNKMK